MKLCKNEYLERPHGNSAIWRYMNHRKFEDLLDKSSLFFANASTLSDQHEVTIPSSVIASKKKEFQKSEMQEKELDEALAAFHWENNPMKDLVLLNCWSIDRFESYALWKIYLGGKKNGVAVRSTVSALENALQEGGESSPEEFYTGRVSYRSHLRREEMNRFSVITTKKPFYRFESEFRVFIAKDVLEKPGSDSSFDIKKGRLVRADLGKMVNSVYISPFADPGYSKTISAMLKAVGLSHGLIRQSEIRDI